MYMGAKQLLQGTYLNKLMLKSYEVFKNLQASQFHVFGSLEAAVHPAAGHQTRPRTEIHKRKKCPKTREIKKNVLIAAA